MTRKKPEMPEKTEYSEAELDAVMKAADAVHAEICPRRVAHNWRECITGRSMANSATLNAIRHLTASPRDVAGARRIFHDWDCMSGCEGAEADDHARRTQAKKATALRRHLNA